MSSTNTLLTFGYINNERIAALIKGAMLDWGVKQGNAETVLFKVNANVEKVLVADCQLTISHVIVSDSLQPQPH
ncbi:MAG TPA: hypothetical protein VIZ65_01885 [Cellvibrionaceae bacterium]